jgi:translation initiation factor 4A
LVELYKNLTIAQCMIFVNKKERVNELTAKLREKSFVVSCIHGELDMIEIEQNMKELKTVSSIIPTNLLERVLMSTSQLDCKLRSPQ